MSDWKQTLTELARDRFVSLKRQAFLLCGDDDQAEDLVQDALVRAFARPLRTPGPGEAAAYVRVTMVNLFIDGERRRSRWNRAAPLLTGAETIKDPIEQILDRNVMLAALNDLPRQQRACVILRFYLDLPITQVAFELGVAEGTVKGYLSEAMTRLAAQLSSAGGQSIERGHTQ